jgi:glycogen debranching enzyme
MTTKVMGAYSDGKCGHFSVISHHADHVWLCLFDEKGEEEIARHDMNRGLGGLFTKQIKNISEGQRYGYRVDGPWEPELGFRFDLSKLLVDPYAVLIDRPFEYCPELSQRGIDTAFCVPKAILQKQSKGHHQPLKPKDGGLMYEVLVKAFSQLNKDVPKPLRGTLSALSHPSSIAHFKKLGVSCVELMPITAWINERHLPPLNLTNAWGYNPVCFMALDPRLAPNGISDLRKLSDALHAEGIALILDVVFNHSGESDNFGPTLSLRGLDNALYYRHHKDEAGALINDTGTGNTLAVERAPVRDLVLDSLRYFVQNGGVDGFRFDLCSILGRVDTGFSTHAPLLEKMRSDPILSQALMIAEPWDIGPGGYQLGNFPQHFLEWNDRYRDDVRKFWRGDAFSLGSLATRLAGSADFFGKNNAVQTRSVNFLAAHDGFTLADVTAYKRKHNLDNGENDRDGHGENFSWNHGVEGETLDLEICQKRLDDIKAMLILLFVSRGTLLLSAGDEFGKTQKGNNNAYAQDNEITWLDWEPRNRDLEDFVCKLSQLRLRHFALLSTQLLTGKNADVVWLCPNGEPMQNSDWENPDKRFLTVIFTFEDSPKSEPDKIAIVINRQNVSMNTLLPMETFWECTISSKNVINHCYYWEIPPCSVAVFELKKGT